MFRVRAGLRLVARSVQRQDRSPGFGVAGSAAGMARVRRAAGVLAIGGAGLLAGCSNLFCCATLVRESGDSIDYVVLGFGVISVPAPGGPPGALVTRVRALGVLASDQPGPRLSVGYAAASAVAVPADTGDTVIEASTCAGTGVIVTGTSRSAMEVGSDVAK